MPEKVTTDIQLRQAKPTDKPHRLQIGNNTYLEVRPNGRKVWIMRYLRPSDKKPNKYTIGDYPTKAEQKGQDGYYSLADAKQAALEAKKLVKRGIDPVKQRQAENERMAALKQASDYSFKSVAIAWHKDRRDNLKKWTDRTAERIMRSLEIHAFPYLGDIPIADIKAPMLLEVLERIVNEGRKIETARKLYRRINAIFIYARVRHIVDSNAAEGLLEELPANEVTHHPHLNDGEAIRHFLSIIQKDHKTGVVPRLAILFTFHTMSRTQEVRFAQWSQFDLEAGLWTIPAEQMKMSRPHIVPLSRQVIALLRELEPFTRKHRYLFVTRSTTGDPMSENAMLQVLYRNNLKGEITIHGLRGTASTFLNNAGFKPEVVDAALSHEKSNKVEGAYNHANYLEHRKPMMQWWSDYLDGVATGADVVPIRQSKAV